jgi:hypothetical protein
LALVGGTVRGSGGVRPNPAMSNATTRRVALKYGVTLFQTEPDIPIPWRRTSGRPDPVSV